MDTLLLVLMFSSCVPFMITRLVLVKLKYSLSFYKTNSGPVIDDGLISLSRYTFT